MSASGTVQVTIVLADDTTFHVDAHGDMAGPLGSVRVNRWRDCFTVVSRDTGALRRFAAALVESADKTDRLAAAPS